MGLTESSVRGAWLATLGDAIAGAAVLSQPSPGTLEPDASLFWVKVHRRLRGQGIGSALYQSLGQHAASQGPSLLVTAHVVTETSGRGFLQARGFSVHRHTSVFEAPLARALTVTRRYYDWLSAGGQIPADARVVPLSQCADYAAVARLVEQHLGGDLDRATRKLLGLGPTAFNAKGSHVVEYRGRVIGAILGRREDNTAIIDVNVVDPAFRHGWPNLILMHTALICCDEDGVTDLRFTARERYRATLKLARHMGAQRVDFRPVYARSINRESVDHG